MPCSCSHTDDINAGTTIRLSADLSSEGLPVPAATVTLKLRKPDNTQVTVAVTAEGDGTYYADVTVSQPGQWFYEWFSPDVGALEEGSFVVRRSAFV